MIANRNGTNNRVMQPNPRMVANDHIAYGIVDA
jgi:hypothetical protein